MGTEIERKFLLATSDWQKLCTKTIYIRQGYLSTEAERVVRIRIWDTQGKLTIKGPKTNAVCDEYEYDIPLDDAQKMLDSLCYPLQIEKKRHIIQSGHHIWEIDEFLGDNYPLVLAEVELEDRSETVILPDWIGQEVTDDHRYTNSELCLSPYNSWTKT